MQKIQAEYTIESIVVPSEMKSIQPTKDSLFAIPGRSTASSMKQTIFSWLYRFHILAFLLATKLTGQL